MTKLKIPVSADDHAEGPESAAVTLVEYGDYECPHCGRAYAIVKRIQKHFGKRLRFVFRNFPLTQSHPNAEAAAESAEFAAAHGKFWEMHDLLFENQEQLDSGLFLDLARKLGLSTPALSLAPNYSFNGNLGGGSNFDAARLTNNLPVALLTNALDGTQAINGGGLTNLNAGQLAGTISPAALTIGSNLVAQINTGPGLTATYTTNAAGLVTVTISLSPVIPPLPMSQVSRPTEQQK